ncbi:hypothetical protein ABCR94_25745 [Streptomyces sp. 21So2-11]|uniref:hypothetical protein n=1 Tax=Streptomyces sp. 21So2-11 TaxID=3144408 RepID=UPI00321A631A
MRAKVNGSYFPGHGTLVEETYLRGVASGEARGRVKAILRLLNHRSIPVPEALAQRITDCTDLDTLDRWLDRAVTADAAEELFVEEETAAPEAAE